MLIFSGWLPKSATYPARLNSLQVNLNAPGFDPTNGTYFINAFKAAGGFSYGAGTSPGNLDNDGYPTGTLSNSLTFNIIFANETTGTGTRWVLKWPATRNIAGLTFSNQFSNVVNSTPSGCTVAASSVTGVAGQACRFSFNFNGLPGNQSFSFTAGTYGGSGDIVLVRAQDEAVSDAGGQNSYYQIEAIQYLRNLGPATIRTMPQTQGLTGNYTNLSRWQYRNQPSGFSWRSRRFPTAVWGGTITGTDIYTVSAPTDAPASLTNGQVVQGVIQNSASNITITNSANNGGNVQLTVSDSSALSPTQMVWPGDINGTVEADVQTTILTVDSPTLITINVPFVHAWSAPSGGLTPRLGIQTLTVTGTTYGQQFIGNIGNGPPRTQFQGAIVAGNSTFTWDTQIHCWQYQADGINGSTPLEALTALSNLVGNTLWINVPAMVDDNYITQAVTYARNNLVTDLAIEYSNEVWNTAFPQTLWATGKGDALGWTGGSSQDTYGWYGLRVRQIAAIAGPLWIANGRSRSTLHLILSAQAFAGYGVVNSSNINQRLNGTQLNGATFPLYCAYVGGSWLGGVCTGDPGYNTAPNRPIDQADVLAYANYLNASWSDVNTIYSVNSNITFLQNVANSWSNGDLAGAISQIDNDMIAYSSSSNTQTVTVSGDTKTFTASGAGFVCSSGGNLLWFTTTGSMFTGVALNTPYWAVGCSSNTFQISLTSGGAAITGISGGTGTQSTTSISSTSILGTARGLEIPWETLAASYDATRAGASRPNLEIWGYEGGPAMAAPDSATCTTIGVTIAGSGATASAALTAALAAWKSSTQAQTTVANIMWPVYRGTNASYFNFGLVPHHKIPSQFQFNDSPVYGLIPGDMFSAPYGGLFYGSRQWQWGITQP